MQQGAINFLEAFKANKGAAIIGLLLFMLLAITNDPDAMATIPADYRPFAEMILGKMKYAILAYGAYAGMKNLSPKELQAKLQEIQDKPDQKVLPPKELLESPVIQEIVENPKNVVVKKKVAKKVAKKAAKKKPKTKTK